MNAVPPGGGSEPVECDGTTTGAVTEDATNSINGEFEDGYSFLSTELTGPWPLLHIMIDWIFSQDFVIQLHFTVDLLCNFNLVSEGAFNVFDPLLEYNGYTDDVSKDAKIETAFYRAQQVQTDWNDPWNYVDIASVIAGLAGLLIGVHPAGTAVWLVSYGALCAAVINAVWNEHLQIQAGMKDRVDAGLYIAFKGALLMLGGESELIGGIGALMTAQALARFLKCIEKYQNIVSGIETGGLGGFVSGIAITGLGLVTMLYGIALAIGEIDPNPTTPV